MISYVYSPFCVPRSKMSFVISPLVRRHRGARGKDKNRRWTVFLRQNAPALSQRLHSQVLPSILGRLQPPAFLHSHHLLYSGEKGVVVVVVVVVFVVFVVFFVVFVFIFHLLPLCRCDSTVHWMFIDYTLGRLGRHKPFQDQPKFKTDNTFVIFFLKM